MNEKNINELDPISKFDFINDTKMEYLFLRDEIVSNTLKNVADIKSYIKERLFVLDMEIEQMQNPEVDVIINKIVKSITTYIETGVENADYVEEDGKYAFQIPIEDILEMTNNALMSTIPSDDKVFDNIAGIIKRTLICFSLEVLLKEVGKTYGNKSTSN